MQKKRTLILISALIVLAVIVGVVATGCGAAAPAAAQTTAATTPQAILTQAVTQALTSSGGITSGAGDFNVNVTVNADTSKTPASLQALLGQPITLSGTFAFNSNPKAAQATINASLMGQKIPAGFEAVNGKAWVQFMGQWYELPAGALRKTTESTAITAATGTTATTGATGTTAGQPNIAAILQALTAAGVDPTTWLSNLTLVGEESLNGTATYHLSGTVDVAKVAADVVKLMQDKNIQSLLPSHGSDTTGSTAGSSAGSTGSSTSLPTQQQLQNIQSQIATMVQNLTLDVWIAKDSYQFRKVEVKATVVPPTPSQTTETTQSTGTTEAPNAALQALQGIAQGIKSVTLDATVSIAPATTPLTVTPPANTKPFSDLQKALGSLQGLLPGVFGTGTTGSTTATS